MGSARVSTRTHACRAVRAVPMPGAVRHIAARAKACVTGQRGKRYPRVGAWVGEGVPQQAGMLGGDVLPRTVVVEFALDGQPPSSRVAALLVELACVRTPARPGHRQPAGRYQLKVRHLRATDHAHDMEDEQESRYRPHVAVLSLACRDETVPSVRTPETSSPGGQARAVLRSPRGTPRHQLPVRTALVRHLTASVPHRRCPRAVPDHTAVGRRGIFELRVSPMSVRGAHTTTAEFGRAPESLPDNTTESQSGMTCPSEPSVACRHCSPTRLPGTPEAARRGTFTSRILAHGKTRWRRTKETTAGRQLMRHGMNHPNGAWGRRQLPRR